MREVFDTWEQDQSNGLWRWLPLDDDLMAAVLLMFESLPATVFLRTGDAIHLVCARENGVAEIYSNDRHLKQAASYFGLTSRDVVPV